MNGEGPVNVAQVERKIREEVLKKTDIRIGTLSVNNIGNSDIVSNLNKVVGKKDLSIVKCKDFQDLTNKLYTKEVDIAILNQEEIPETQTVFFISTSEFLLNDNNNVDKNYFVAIPKGENNKKSFSVFFKY